MQQSTQKVIFITNKAVLQFFWKYIKPYKWFYALMLLAPTIGAFYSLGYNFAVKLFIDAFTSTEVLTYRSVLLPLGVFVTTQLSMDIVWRVSNYAEWKSEPYVRRSLIMQAYDHVQNHSYTFFQNHFTGAVTSKLKGLLDGYERFWGEMHHGLFSQVLSIVVNLVALIFINIYLGIFITVWAMLFIPIMYHLSKRMTKLAQSRTDAVHTIFGQISDKITNIFSILAFAAKKREYTSLDNYIEQDFIPKEIKMYKYDFMLQIFAMVMYLILFFFIAFFMVYLRLHDLITTGDFALVFGLTLAATNDTIRVTYGLQTFAMAMGDLKSSLTILETRNIDVDKPNAKKLLIKSPVIEFKNVKFGYNPQQLVLKDLNLNIKAGEKIGLVGQSGAGKSTLVNLLLRYFFCLDGKIEISQQNIDLVTQDSLRDQVSVIPQDILLFHRTIMENIRFGRIDATDEEVFTASKKAHIHEFVNSLPDKYNTYVGERGIKLSGGQRQRIAIARAILKNAPILILDEATSSLDSETENLIQESLNLFLEDRSKTIIAIAHRLSTLKHMDRIIVLDKGLVIEEGTHEELLQKNNSLYKKLWDLQEI